MKELANISRFGTGFLLMVGLMFISSCKQENPPVEDIRRDATVIAVEKVMPSVVNMVTASRTPAYLYEDQMPGFGLPSQLEEHPDSVGSGVIIDDAGYVLTSLHVLQAQSRMPRVAVKLWDGREFDCDPIVATTNSDIALVKIHAPPGEKFQPIKLAQDDDLMLGETVIAIGNPLNLGGSVTKGILSSRSRRLPMGDGPLNFRDWLQTDAAINEGNSGGPLVNLKGEMIGLNEAVVTNQQNIGFAIPVKQIQKALSQFFTPEVLNQIWFGGQVNGGHGPLHFDFVEPDSPAFRAGLRVSDEVVSVNGVAVQNPIQFHRALCGSLTNHNVEAKMVVRRSGENYNTAVQLISFDNFFRSKLGITLAQSDAGLVIETVEPDSPAAVAQLQPGFFLAGIDGKRLFSLLDAARVLSATKKGDNVSLNLVARKTTGLQVQIQQGTVNAIVR